MVPCAVSTGSVLTSDGSQLDWPIRCVLLPLLSSLPSSSLYWAGDPFSSQLLDTNSTDHQGSGIIPTQPVALLQLLQLHLWLLPLNSHNTFWMSLNQVVL